MMWLHFEDPILKLEANWLKFLLNFGTRDVKEAEDCMSRTIDIWIFLFDLSNPVLEDSWRQSNL